MTSITINTDTLENACNRIIQKLRDTGIRQINVSEDMYWELSHKQAYSVPSDVKPEMIGSLSDDWTELKKSCIWKSGNHIR